MKKLLVFASATTLLFSNVVAPMRGGMMDQKGKM